MASFEPLFGILKGLIQTTIDWELHDLTLRPEIQTASHDCPQILLLKNPGFGKSASARMLS